MSICYLYTVHNQIMFKLSNILSRSQLAAGSLVWVCGLTLWKREHSFNKGAQKPLLVAIGNAVNDYTVVGQAQDVPVGVELTAASKDFKRQVIDQVMNNPKRKVTVGGSALNTARMAGVCARGDVEVCFVGSVGDDRDADIIENACKQNFVRPFLHRVKGDETGKCVILVDQFSRDRSIVCFRGAAAHMSPAIFNSQPFSMLRALMGAREPEDGIFFATSYNLTTLSRYQVVQEVVDRFQNLRFALSLSSADLLTKSPIARERVTKLLPHTSFLFATKHELNAYFQSNDKENARKLVDMMAVDGVCVISDGPNNVLVATKQHVIEYPVRKVPVETIVDTTGCGDSLAGTILALVLLKKPLSECVEKGILHAQKSLECMGIAANRDVKLHLN